MHKESEEEEEEETSFSFDDPAFVRCCKYSLKTKVILENMKI